MCSKRVVAYGPVINRRVSQYHREREFQDGRARDSGQGKRVHTCPR
jgi:hypothetical protein